MDYTAKHVALDRLDEFGFPKEPNRIFIGVKRVVLDGINFNILMLEQRPLEIKCRFAGESRILSGKVLRISRSNEGTVVHLRPTHHLMKNWPRALLWIPKEGPAGILS